MEVRWYNVFELGLFAILTSVFRLSLDVWRVERQCIGPTLDGCMYLVHFKPPKFVSMLTDGGVYIASLE